VPPSEAPALRIEGTVDDLLLEAANVEDLSVAC
jgi:hypothetical protein